LCCRPDRDDERREHDGPRQLAVGRRRAAVAGVVVWVAVDAVAAALVELPEDQHRERDRAERAQRHVVDHAAEHRLHRERLLSAALLRRRRVERKSDER
jgi:hypothetical protein